MGGDSAPGQVALPSTAQQVPLRRPYWAVEPFGSPLAESSGTVVVDVLDALRSSRETTVLTRVVDVDINVI